LRLFEAKNRKRFETNIILFSVWFVLTATSAIWIYLTVIKSKNNHENIAQIASRNIALALDSSISESVKNIDLMMLSTVDFMEDQLKTRERVRPEDFLFFVQRQEGRIPELSGVRATDEQGHVLYGADITPLTSASWGDRPFLNQLRDGKRAGLVVPDPIFGKVTKRWILPFVRRYNHPDGRFAGVVSYAVEVDYLQSILSRLEVGEHGIALIRDSQLGMIARYPKTSGPSGAIGAKGFSPELEAAIESGKAITTFHTQNTADGAERINTYRRLERAPFHLVAGLGSEDYLKTWHEEVQAAWLEWLAFLFITTAGLLYLNRVIRQTEELALSKGRFLANMSHEIRTPMNAILGMLNLVQNTELTARQADYIRKTEVAAKSLLGLLGDILDFSKTDAGKMTLEREPFRLDQLLRDLSVVLSANTGTSDVEVLYDVGSGLPEVVAGDAMRLHQVLVNLGGNAVKFTRAGQVVVSLRPLASTPTSVTIEFAVQDTGIGIAPEHQKHIFNGFSQAETSTTRKYGGTGLGLAISKRLVELMGGQLTLTSTLGVGSTFWFAVEFALVVDIPAPLRRPARQSLSPRRTLVVDDNPIARRITQSIAQSWGWPVDSAAGAAQALEMVHAQLESHPGQFPYDLVFLDWEMPQVDGWETARRLREICTKLSGTAPALIMLTASGRHGLAQRSAEEQAMLAGFLVKPTTASMLFDAVTDSAGHPPLAPSTPTPRERLRRLQDMRILLVEDNLINQQVAQELLSAEGAVVVLATNGQLGVDAIKNAPEPFDVVLMDIHMPILDGYGATDIIRNQLGLKALPIVAMTANAMPGDRTDCLAAGMNEHIGKPFDLGQLVALLRAITGADGSAAMPQGAQPLQAPWPALAGIDLEAALSRLGGQRALYVDIAREFMDELHSTLIELDDKLGASDAPHAKRLLHTLKGNAGTLGLQALANECARLERLCKDPGLGAKGLEQCRAELPALKAAAESAKALLQKAVATLAGAADTWP
jgi:signal transduction histidine kinase/CheY-like chemotaxis protein